MAVVYWIRLEEHDDINSQGYVGITKDFNSRMSRHRRLWTGPHFKSAIIKYGWDNLIKDVVFEGSIEDCRLEEYRLRPDYDIGWNINIGGEINASTGARTPEGKARIAEFNRIRNTGSGNPAAKLTDIYDYRTNQLVAKDVCMAVWCRENNVKKSNLCRTITGVLNHSGGYYARRTGR